MPYILKKEKLRFLFPFFSEMIKMPGSLWPSTFIKRAKITHCLITFTFLLLLGSCTPAKKTAYFLDIPRDTILTNLVTKNFDTKIQNGDLLNITVSSLSPENTAFYNVPQNAIGTQSGYLVDENGTIQFVKLGTIPVAGLSRKELKSKLQKDLSAYLAQPIVSIGFLNRHVTMMGAISPQVLPITGDHMTLLDALAASGDIGSKGRTDNILVIREMENGKEFKRLDLTDKSIFYSPYFYLQPNDVIYVEPVKEKVNKTAQIISYVTAGISFFILIIDRITK